MDEIAYYYGATTECWRCHRPIVLHPMIVVVPAMLVWRPDRTVLTWQEREDCPKRSGDRCTPYPPE